METYIVFLRGINVSGQKKIKMLDLKSMLEKLGFDKVQTYIQSGNVVLTAIEKDAEAIELKIKSSIAKTFGYEVPVIAKSKKQIEEILERNPYKDFESLDKKGLYFVLLKNRPEEKFIKDLEAESYDNEQFSITEDCVYLLCLTGYGKAKLNNNLIERKLRVEATTRNYRTMMKLFAMAD
ncbi:MAG: DUF1697 domain-containing protein [Pricia sp.]|nr:DUF1697 domain-containing protein [Pricia sp.]